MNPLWRLRRGRPAYVQMGRWLAVIHWVMVAAAFLAAMTVLPGAAVLVLPFAIVCGAFVIAAGIRGGSRLTLALGVLWTSTEVGCFLVVAYMLTFPNADFGFLIAKVWSGAATGVSVPFVCKNWRKPLAGRNPYECRGCGYFLYGLTEPRCPECGTAFDQKLFEERGHH